MSGGSYNYEFMRIEALADAIQPSTPLRRVFKKHLHNVATACRQIEWVDSGDSADGAEDEAIVKCLGKDAHASIVQELIDEALRAKAELDAEIAAAQHYLQAKAEGA